MTVLLSCLHSHKHQLNSHFQWKHDVKVIRRRAASPCTQVELIMHLTQFPGPTQVHNPNSIATSSSVFYGSRLCPTDAQTNIDKELLKHLMKYQKHKRLLHNASDSLLHCCQIDWIFVFIGGINMRSHLIYGSLGVCPLNVIGSVICASHRRD